MCAKGGNSKNIDQEVRKIELPNFQSIDNSNLSLDDSILCNSETSVKSLDNSQTFLKDVTKNDEHETREKCKQTHEIKDKQITPQKSDGNDKQCENCLT